MRSFSVLAAACAFVVLALGASAALAQGRPIVNLLSNRCIDVPGQPGTAQGTALQLWDCETRGRSMNGAVTDQRWEWVNNGFIRNVLSGLCLDVQGEPGTANGSRLILAKCEFNGRSPHGQPTDQMWFTRADGAIVNQYSMKCIDVSGAPGTTNGARLQVWDCETSGRNPNGSLTDQRWRF